MPGVRDDIIIKGLILGGMFEAAEHVSEQIEKCGLLGDCKAIDAKLRSSYEQFRDTLQWAIDEMEDKVTRKMVP